jgi:hypothetical protein
MCNITAINTSGSSNSGSSAQGTQPFAVVSFSSGIALQLAYA